MIAVLSAQLGYQADAQAMRGRLARILPRSDHLVLVAESQGRICGWLQAHLSEIIESGPKVEIVGLIVEEHSRRAGIGRQLVEQAERWAAGAGVNSIVVRSNVARVESHAFYLSLGYAKAKTQAVYRKDLQEAT